jgi:aminoglycoside 3-N-acetyltransferase
MMLELTPQVLEQALTTLGITKGDGLLVHSSLHLLGKPSEGIGTYFNVLRKVIGEEGTIVVPTFTLDYPTTQVFVREKTPSKNMGSFSEYVRQFPESFRTSHPLQSVAVCGFYARDLAGRDTTSAFEEASAFARMLELDFKLLLLGADIQSASMVHYCEAKASVPYRKWKDFTGSINQDGRWINKTYRMYARILEIEPRLELRPIQAELERRDAWHKVALNYGFLSCFRLQDFVAATDTLLSRNPWILVSNRLEAKEKLERLKG